MESLEVLLADLNMTANYLSRPDAIWGAKNKTTGQFDGMISSAISGEADLIFAP